MKEFRYILDKSSRKCICPGCQKKHLVLFKDAITGQYMPEHYGRCDREANCGYFNAPGNNAPRMTIGPRMQPRKDVYMPNEILHQTLKQYEINTFIQNLLKIAPANEVEKIISLYYLGTTKAGAVTMPFIDINSNVRAIQVKSFDSDNHYTNTTFLHSIIEAYHRKKNEALPGWLAGYLQNESKVSCLFGEHLLKRYPNNPIALIEAPKGAIYGSLYFGGPEDPFNYLWIGVYNLTSLTLKKCMALKGREVVLFPDLSKTGHAFDLWKKRADEFNTTIPGATFRISDLLEKHATPEQRVKGLDLADYLTQFDWHKFRQPPTEQRTPAQVKPMPAPTEPTPAHIQSAGEPGTTNEQATTTIGQKIPEAQGCNKIETDRPEPQQAPDPDDLILQPGINYSLSEIAQAMKRIDASAEPLKTLERITKENSRVHWCKINSEVYLSPF